MSLVQRLAKALTLDFAGKADLLPGDDPLALVQNSAPAPVPAAVLIAFTDQSQPNLVLTQRRADLRKYPGQVAFPGGRVDAHDTDHIATALREAWEEIALDPAQVTVIGATDRYQSVTGYTITPVLGVIPAGLSLTANPDEVAAIFEVPAAYLFNPANYQMQTILHNGQERSYYELHYSGYRIWGATAAMILNLGQRLAWH